MQAHLPLLIGGSGRKVTLRLVAEYAGICNIGGSPKNVAETDAVLLEHCDATGRDERTIERSINVGVPMIRDDRSDARRDHAALFAHNGGTIVWPDQPVGTAEDVYELLAPYVELGYHHLVFYFTAPYDEETMTRLATEVRPRLAALITS